LGAESRERVEAACQKSELESWTGLDWRLAIGPLV
jgi:hypothetical protein